MVTLTLTEQQVAVLFHVTNNIGVSQQAFDEAASRAAEVDSIDRETFIKVFSHPITTLSNT